MLDSFLDRTLSLFSRRFLIVAWLPTFFVFLIISMIYLIGHGLLPILKLWNKYYNLFSQFHLSLYTVLPSISLLIITIIAIALDAFTYWEVRQYVSFGESLPFFKSIRKWKKNRLLQDGERYQNMTHEQYQNMAHKAQYDLYYNYPLTKEALYPTQFGNVLQAAVDYGHSRYGMDIPFWFPRLWELLPKDIRLAMDNAMTMIAMLINLINITLMIAIVTVLHLKAIGLSHLWHHPSATQVGVIIEIIFLLLIIPIIKALYQGAVKQAKRYGEYIRVATDLYRFKLLEALHIPLPTTPTEEKLIWYNLSTWLYNADRGRTTAIKYKHSS